MKLRIRPYDLEFRHPFGVSSNTRKYTTSVFIQLESGRQSGYGEACIPEYLGETLADTIVFFEKAGEVLANYEHPFDPEKIIAETDLLSGKNNAAKAAIDMAVRDLHGRLLNKPFYEIAGIGKSVPRLTSFTIGIDSESKLEQKITEASDFGILKIKAGTDDDKGLIRRIRKYTNKPLFVDVNQGWKDKKQVAGMASWMKDEGVVLIEQPMPVGMIDEMRWVMERSPIPVFADESVKRLSDLERIKDAFSGINIKLMKCTGLGEAIQMIRWARKNNMQVMLGCMAESSCAASAMAQLMKLADYIDLDAPQLYMNDPFEGIHYSVGKVVLNDLPGIGVKMKTELFHTG